MFPAGGFMEKLQHLTGVVYEFEQQKKEHPA